MAAQLDTTGLLLVIALALGCAQPPAVEVVMDPDPAATGQDGERGPFGVARAGYQTQARVSESVRFEATWPALSSGELDPAEAPYPCVLSVQGGFVSVERYRWLAEHMASRGYVVLAPRHSLQLAILESDNASYALDEALERAALAGDPLAGALEPDGPVAIMGHSLGGVVAAMGWVADPRVDGVAILASYAAGSTEVEAMAGQPSLLLTGSEDRKPPEEFYPEWERFPEPRWGGVIEGMNHYDWTDDPTEGELARDGRSTRPAEQSRTDAWRVLDAWLDATLLGDPEAAAALDEGGFPGVEERW
jgi:dienelactone hydrolase